jgi:hypothetical protein
MQTFSLFSRFLSRKISSFLAMPKKAPTVKKAVPKKAVKKAVAKKATPKTSSKKKSLVYADNTHSFWVVDGQILNSLSALHAALAVMDKGVYSHHVGKDRHDFADWVDVVLGDAACALDVRKAKTAKAAHTAVTKHLKKYSL